MEDPGQCDSHVTRLKRPMSRRSWIDAEYTDENSNPKVRVCICVKGLELLSDLRSQQVRNGVKMGEGDGTVSLISLGAMCVEGWKRKRWNPAGIKVTTIEVKIPLGERFLPSSLLIYYEISFLIFRLRRSPAEALTRVIMLIFWARHGSMRSSSKLLLGLGMSFRTSMSQILGNTHNGCNGTE
jgi:hypothetical protein